MTLEVVASIVIAFVTFVVGPTIVGWFAWQRGKRQAEAAAEKDLNTGWRERAEGDATVAGAVFQWSDRLRAQVEKLEGQLEVTRAEVEKLEQGMDDLRRKYEQVLHHNYLLIRQIEGLGVVPVGAPGVEPWREYGLVDQATRRQEAKDKKDE